MVVTLVASRTELIRVGGVDITFTPRIETSAFLTGFPRRTEAVRVLSRGIAVAGLLDAS